MRTFFANLTGANCHLSGQTIVALSVSEDAEADYDTASAVCLAPGGNFGKGSLVETIEGGTSTGYWEVEDPVVNRSGEKTWRRRAGVGYAHLPLVSYRLRRKGYMQGRSTLCKAVVGANNYPPKFCTTSRFAAITAELQQQYKDRAIDAFEFQKLRATWHPVWGPEYIAAQVAQWVGLSIHFGTRLSHMPDEYIPVDRPAITAIREIASWSGASVLLDRNGVLRVFNWQDTLGRGGSRPSLGAVLEEETHDCLPALNQVTVVGNTYAPPSTRNIYGTKLWPLEVTEQLARAPGERIVSERIEMRNYPITPNLAKKLAQERLCRAHLQANASRWIGPAEGSQSIRPLVNGVLSVNRTLNWTGTGYRYEIQVSAAPRSVPFGGDSSSVGGWW